MLEFRLLGPFEVWDGERPVVVSGRKPRALLAALLLRAGEIASAERLIDELWGESPPQTAKAALQNYVSQLRKELGAGVVVTRPHGYAVEVDAEQVDVRRFERLVADARAVGADDQRVERFREALSLWRGPALADLALEPLALLEAPRLEDLRLAAQEDLFDAELALGQHAEVLPELEALVEEQPYDERLRGQLMLCLYRAGRQADALTAFRETRAFLVEELGLEPSQPLRDLEQAILRQDPTLAPSAPAPAVVLPVRKTVTVLFADLVESTALAERLDPEVLWRLLDRVFEAMRAAVERHGGVVEKFIGDAVLAVFGLPQAHEDDALRALRAAVELRAQVMALGEQVELRVGVNTGEVFAGAPGSSQALVTGGTVNVTKRLEEAAPTGEIVLGASTLRLVREAVRAEPLPVVRVRGESTVPAWQLVELVEGAPAIPRRLQAPLVGREQELDWLRSEFGRVCSEGRCRFSLVVGEPGIGKTRLTRELISELDETATVLAGGCVAYGQGAAWLPLADIVRSAGADNVEAIETLLAGDQEAQLVARRIGGALGWTDEPAPLEETRWAVRRLMQTLVRERPLLVLVEDVHWADPALLELLDDLGERAQGPILLLCTTRPELLETRPEWADAAVTLTPLPEIDVAELVDSLGLDVDADVRARVVEVGEGNPLFVEQLVAHAQEEGASSLDAVPPSVEALLASRLDLLQPEERALAQRAAVIGREFTRPGLLALSPSGLTEQLRALEERGHVHARGGDSYRFHHALVRDVAYTGTPKTDRAHLHEQYANWLEHDAADRISEVEEILGYHLELAHHYHTQLGLPDDHTRALASRAAHHLTNAGRRAVEVRTDPRAGANLLSRAVALLPQDDQARPDVLRRLATQVWRTQDARTATMVAREAVEGAVVLGDRSVEWRARLTEIELRSGWDPTVSHEEYANTIHSAIEVFNQIGDEGGLMNAWGHLTERHASRGRYSEAAGALERALEHARRGGFPEDSLLLDFVSIASGGPMPVGEAIGRIRELFDRTDRLGIEAPMLGYLGELEAMRGRFDDARELCGRCLAILDELGNRLMRGIYEQQAGSVELLARAPPEAERRYRTGYQILESLGESYRRCSTAGYLAEAIYEQGRYEEAERFAELGEELSAPDDVDARYWSLSVRAKIEAQRDSFSEAEHLARAAVALVDETETLNAQANARAALGEVLMLAGRRNDGEDVFGEALNLYEQKGNVAGAARARARCVELLAPSGV